MGYPGVFGEEWGLATLLLRPRALPCLASSGAAPWKAPLRILLSGREGPRSREEELAEMFEAPVTMAPAPAHPISFPFLPSLPSPHGLQEQSQPHWQLSQNNRL